MSELQWRPMFLAPKDGSPFAVLLSDFSGLEGFFWGEDVKTGESCWVSFGMECSDEEILSGAGWVPLPRETRYYEPKGKL